MEKKKLTLSISGSSKKTISSIEKAKSHSKNSVLIEKKPSRFGNKQNYLKTSGQADKFKPISPAPMINAIPSKSNIFIEVVKHTCEK